MEEYKTLLEGTEGITQMSFDPLDNHPAIYNFLQITFFLTQAQDHVPREAGEAMIGAEDGECTNTK
jgi:hypothetical protein